MKINFNNIRFTIKGELCVGSRIMGAYRTMLYSVHSVVTTFTKCMYIHGCGSRLTCTNCYGSFPIKNVNGFVYRFDPFSINMLTSKRTSNRLTKVFMHYIVKSSLIKVTFSDVYHTITVRFV